MVNFAVFEGQICDNDDMPFDEDDGCFLPTGIVPETVGAVQEHGESTDEKPLTMIHLTYTKDEWFVVRGTIQQTIDILKQASKRF